MNGLMVIEMLEEAYIDRQIEMALAACVDTVLIWPVNQGYHLLQTANNSKSTR